MAAISESAFFPFQGMKAGSGKQSRQELEEEVRKLQKILSDEEKVNEFLQLSLLPNCIPPALDVPDFLPKKEKELLAELIMLEEEIARLEAEISKIQHSISSKEESLIQDSKMFNLNKPKVTTLIESSNSPLNSPTKIQRSNVFEETARYESKPMFFINQVIKGTYSNHGFASDGERLETASMNERQRMVNNQVRTPNRSGMIDSQKRPPRHPIPRQSDSNVNILQKLLHEHTLSTTPLDNNGQKWQPNILSEKILKYLICIFLRLMRKSRTMEIEKLNNISKFGSSILRTTSFRMDRSFNLNRETVQQDPYGIFQMDDSLVRDIGPYKNLVVFTSSFMELKGISNCLPLLNKLRNLMSNLHEVKLKSLTHQQKLAFWINIHNICVMHGFLEHGLPSNPEKILGLRNKAVLNVGGNNLNALAIEHFILRHPSNTKETHLKSDIDVKEDKIRIMYGLEQAEPNVQFALCFGNRSSPAVKIYTSDGVSAELEKSKVEYLQASIAVTTARRIKIPKLLFSNMSDMAEDLQSMLECICSQLPTSGALRKSITECVRGQINGNITDIVEVLPCDFEFQYLLPL